MTLAAYAGSKDTPTFGTGRHYIVVLVTLRNTSVLVGTILSFIVSNNAGVCLWYMFPLLPVMLKHSLSFLLTQLSLDTAYMQSS